MKIITRGEAPELREYRVTCNNCRTVFEFAAHEAATKVDARDGNYLAIQCPVCLRECTTGTGNFIKKMSQNTTNY